MTADTRDLEHDIGNNALQVLIQQFSNRFDFVRELVQNSLDAGTAEVDVWTAFHFAETEENEAGVCEIHVDDNGCGMDEQIIDKSLTRLFSSTKEDDLTSIGKFGIGFVSVFAPNPDGVLLRTAKGGERWEVFFDKDRNVEKTRLDFPVEGTQITIFKSMSRTDYIDTVREVHRMLKYWCRFAEGQIWFRDTAQMVELEDGDSSPSPAESKRRRRAHGRISINEPLRVDGEFGIRIKRGEAEIAMAFCESPEYGFYNRGLTLKETDRKEILGWAAPFFSNVSFRIKSPHLEHTLTRDTIILDDNYQKALLTLVDAARVDLVENLLQALENAAAAGPKNGAMPDDYMNGLHILFTLNREMDPVFDLRGVLQDRMDTAAEKFHRAAAGIFHVERQKKPDQRSVNASTRKLFRRCHGDPCTLAEIENDLFASEQRLILSDRESEMTLELADFEKGVYFAPTESEAVSFFLDKIFRPDKDSQSHERVFFIGSHIWLTEPLKHEKLTPKERALFDTLTALTRPAGISLMPVNFLGDNTDELILGGGLVDHRVAFKLSRMAPKPSDVLIDVKGRLFQTLSQLLSAAETHDLALLSAADEATKLCGRDLQAELAVLAAAKEKLQ